MRSNEDRRRYERIEESVCVWLSFVEDRAAYSTMTMDIALEGARFSTPRRVRVGERLGVQIQLPGDAIECQGEVRWSDLCEDGTTTFGVQFLNLTEKQRTRMAHHLYKPALETAGATT